MPTEHHEMHMRRNLHRVHKYVVHHGRVRLAKGGQEKIHPKEELVQLSNSSSATFKSSSEIR